MSLVVLHEKQENRPSFFEISLFGSITLATIELDRKKKKKERKELESARNGGNGFGLETGEY